MYIQNLLNLTAIHILKPHSLKKLKLYKGMNVVVIISNLGVGKNFKKYIVKVRPKLNTSTYSPGHSSKSRPPERPFH